MLDEMLNFLEPQKILILGMGIEGKATYHFLRNHFPEKQLFIADKNEDIGEKNPVLKKDKNLEIVVGENYLKGLENYDLIMKTPGISLKNVDISSFQDKITSQLALFLQFVECFSIGITGTKGKSTTSSLLYQVLKEQGKEVFLLGNIGEPIFNCIEQIQKNSMVVLELSSHGLQYVRKSPKIAVLLNLYEEHLDYYSSFEEYVQAKFNITKYQKEEDQFIYNYDNKTMKKYTYRPKDYAVTFGPKPNTKNAVYLHNKSIYCNNTEMMAFNQPIKLKGEHQKNNIMFVLAIVHILKLDLERAIQTIQNFEPLEHRMELVGKINGVTYYNDSIATIPEATIGTIKALENVNTLIIGGKDRGVKFQELLQFLTNSKVENIICLPKTGEWIYQELRNNPHQKLYFVSHLQEAVQIAKQCTKKNSICVLSPAASSYGYFKSFEERGKLYKKFVRDDIKMTKNNELT